MTSSTAAQAAVQPRERLTAGEQLQTMMSFAAVLVASFVYVSYTGLVAHFGDSFLLANRAKHLADEFNLNLNNGLVGLIYPPLYPILIAFAYRFHDPHVIFKAILVLNVFLTASQVFPLRLLLEQYSNLSRKNAIWLAAAIAVSPASLPYTSMEMTEVLYCPLLLWTAFFVNRAIQRDNKLDFLRAGVMLALCMLTRSAAAMLLVAYAVTLVLYLWQGRNPDLARRLKAGAFSALSFTAVYGAWIVFERFFVKYEGFMPQFELMNVAAVFQHAQQFDLRVGWLANCLFYYLTAPLSLAGAFVFVLFVRKPGLLRRDLTAVFLVSSILVSAVVASFVTADRGDSTPELTWNRYVMPYVAFVLILAVRHRKYFTASFFFLSATAMAVTALSFRPTYLSSWVADALSLVDKNRPLHLSDAVVNLLYFAIIVTTGWLWPRKSRAAKQAALIVTGLLWLGTEVASAHAHRVSKFINVSASNGIVERAYEKSLIYPHTQIYYDPVFPKGFTFQELRMLYLWPNLDIRPLKRYQFARLDPPANTHVLYFTASTVDAGTPVGEELGIRSYDVTGEQLREFRARVQEMPVEIDMADDFPQVEGGAKGGKNYSVRWLRRNTDFHGTFQPAAAEAVVSLELATNGPPRTAALIVNEEPASETYLVTGNFWTSPATIARFHVSLRHGLNSFRLNSVEPGGKLPDGREVAFLMIGDVQVLRPKRNE